MHFWIDWHERQVAASDLFMNSHIYVLATNEMSASEYVLVIINATWFQFAFALDLFRT